MAAYGYVAGAFQPAGVNVQNIPRKDTIVKQAFVPKLDALVFCDYKQIEPRLFGYYTHELGSPRFANYIRGGVDPYTAVGIGYFGKDELSDAERQLAKQTFLSLTYGGGLPAIRRYFSDLSWDGAAKVKEQFERAWPELAILQNRLEQRVAERGYITTLWGRHLKPDSAHKLVNSLLQGCAADLMRVSMVKVHEYLTAEGFVSHLVSSVHDELVIDAVNEEMDALAEAIPLLMDHAPLSAVLPIEVDFEWSTTNWAEKGPYEKEVPIAA